MTLMMREIAAMLIDAADHWKTQHFWDLAKSSFELDIE